MGLFKNGVGRPSNETLKKRRIIATIMIFAVVLAVGVCVFYTVNYFKGVSGTDKNVSSSTLAPTVMAKNNSGKSYIHKYVTDIVTESWKGNYYLVGGNNGSIEVELASSNKATITLKTIFNKDVAKGFKKGLKKYYYQMEIATYDKNGEQIGKTGRINISKTTIEKSFIIGTNFYKFLITIYNPTLKKENQQVAWVNITELKPIAAKDSSTTMSKAFPDASFRSCVLSAYNKKYNTNKTVLTDAELAKITSLACIQQGITNAKGLERLKGLTSLNLSNNPIETINLSQNTNLASLQLDGTKLKNINVTKNTKLEQLWLGDNEAYSQCRNNITSLDLSKNTNLKRLKLYKLHIKKLNLTKNTKLETLIVKYSGLESIDLSKNTKLTEVDLQNNNLKKLNVTKNINLKELVAVKNQLTSINVSKNVNLESLYLGYNKLTSLDVSKNTKLKELEVLTNNNITKEKIKVGNNKNLKIS